MERCGKSKVQLLAGHSVMGSAKPMTGPLEELPLLYLLLRQLLRLLRLCAFWLVLTWSARHIPFSFRSALQGRCLAPLIGFLPSHHTFPERRAFLARIVYDARCRAWLPFS